MSISRRNLLQYAGASCALALVPELAAADTLRRYQVSDAAALPRFAAGDVLVADTAIAAFAGDGIYLYPAWGAPRLYEVRAAEEFLEFRNPGTGQLLWKQSAGLDATFAGRALAGTWGATAAAQPQLRVPALPATA